VMVTRNDDVLQYYVRAVPGHFSPGPEGPDSEGHLLNTSLPTDYYRCTEQLSIPTRPALSTIWSSWYQSQVILTQILRVELSKEVWLLVSAIVH